MATGTPKLEWDERHLNGILGAVKAFRDELQTQCDAIDSLMSFGDPGSLESAQNTRDNLIHDAQGLKSKLAGYIAYLDNVHAQVNGDVQFLLTR
ncbi:hypothetical protein LK468_16905 [Mycobacteroides abscessus]|uniref:hypothetical protein n=1 Tax=Mycobacteroides abscessus TaxID=36809 RepID=UPI0005E4F922|nr:hypothetical protein [Mycobacteroides abscessus]MDO3300428.1 hypothetical protein [Mycobacteroides abscessus subsp. massiliense]UEA47893.1 hypothetical protein LK451_19320 [Mycobacteroides abscessus subsp. abscessus]UEA52126.1 hypothetical protein LK468_16905 [Mycobacteroides abscessus]CPW81510.1 Uncharacterised protein [Mycobacteroides abscessus]SKE36044.1 Uncharacterised protein [Mycobacteroides abscessus subsp. bolletii]